MVFPIRVSRREALLDVGRDSGVPVKGVHFYWVSTSMNVTRLLL